MIGLRVALKSIGFILKEPLRVHLDERFVGHLGNVGTGGECFFRTGNDYAAHLVARIGLFKRGAQLAKQHTIKRIHRVRSVKRYRGDIVTRIDDDLVIGHAAVPFAAGQSPRLNKAHRQIKLSLALRAKER